MTIDSEHKIYSILAAIQCVIVIVGTMVLGLWLRVFRYGQPDAWPDAAYRPVSVFFRSWGLLLLIVPMIWVLGSIALERRNPTEDTTGYRVVSGYALIVMLALFFGWITVTSVRFGMLETVPR